MKKLSKTVKQKILLNKKAFAFAHIYICIYVSFSWPNGLTKTAESIFFSKINFNFQIKIFSLKFQFFQFFTLASILYFEFN